MKPNVKLEPYRLGEVVLQEGFLGKAIAECLMNGDHEGVVEVVSIYLDILNKTKLAKEANMQRSTIYQAIKGKNPTIKTLSRIVHRAVSVHKAVENNKPARS